MVSYRRVSLGRMAVFLLPSLKLKRTMKDGWTVEERIGKHLIDEYGGYTSSAGNTFGYWKDEAGEVGYSEHRVFTVSFEGKERIASLEQFLAEIAVELGEKCIYLETGEDSWLIYPVVQKWVETQT